MKKFLKKYFWGVIFVPLFFLLFGIATIKDYGINWDEPFHFMRGQAYLNFFLSGRKDYSNLPVYPRLSKVCPDWAKGKCNISPGGATDILSSVEKGTVYGDTIKLFYPKGFLKLWRSMYQHDTYDFNSIIIGENGHPPLNDILAAFTNYIFFQRLHLLGDDATYHLFEVLAAFSIVLGVSIFTFKKLGKFAATVAGLSISLYPLFFAESHFNIKDPVEAAFYGLSIIFFFLGITEKSWKKVVISSIFAAFALGTKFNALFLVPTLGIWLIFDFIINIVKAKNKKSIIRSYFKPLFVASIFAYPIITLGIFYALWPYLWPDPIKNIMVTIGYYKQIGTGVSGETTPFMIKGWNTYPIRWIFYTTPIPIIFLSSVGLFRSIIKSFKKDSPSFLLVLWFLIPIVRVSWPGSNIYGGVRQIMEYIPPMAILVGVGAVTLVGFAKKYFGITVKNVVVVFILTAFVFVSYELFRIHPNENVYFNQIIGGLSGAKAKNIPSWGNAYGNVYLQGVNWINKNVEPNAKLGLAVSTMGNVPKLELRTDIDFFNGNYSGLNRKGEYEMEMDFDWWPKYFYSFQYLDAYLNPVYTVTVDGVPLLKVWKNDLEHTKTNYKNEIQYTTKNISFSNSQILIDLGREIFLTRLDISHGTTGCETLKDGYILTSLDKTNWDRERDPLAPQVPNIEKEFTKSNFVFLFPAKKTRYILVNPISTNSCLSRSANIKIRGLEILPD